MSGKTYANLVLLAVLMALAVISLGAYVRLSDAGLGCPDWPGCYGHIGVPQDTSAIAAANEAFPDRPVEPGKAWKEMVHRYLAGGLGLMILALAIFAWRNPAWPRKLPLAIVGLVILQALLGMWTVTLLLKPLIVVLHLLGGMSVAALLWWLWLRHSVADTGRGLVSHRRLALTALVVLALQVSLGGWTSSNYAATACPDFPTCQGAYWPDADYSGAFVLWRGLGVDYEGGVLATPARVAIHFAHRLGAIMTVLIIGLLFLRAFPASSGAPRRALIAMLGMLLLQAALGIGLIKFGFPLMIAVAHNGVAALLILSLVSVNFLAFAKPVDAQ